MHLHVIYLLSLILHSLIIVASPRLEKLTSNHLPNKLQQTISSSLPKKDSSNILPLDLRSIKDWKLTDLLLISDIDGNLHGLERNSGTLLWTLPIDDPLVRIHTNNSIENSRSNILWFVEPYQDGSLYYFTPRFGLNKLPTSIKDLVLESPFSLNGDDKIYTGTRRTSLFTINIHSGEIVSSFGNNEEKCPVPNTHYKIQNFNNEDTIMIGKTTYELSIHSKENTSVVWNVTYSQWGPNNIDNDLIMQNQQSLDKLYFTPFHDKSLLAINKDLGTPLWISKLPSLAVNVFDVFSDSKTSDYVLLPHPLKVLNNLQIQNDDYTENNELVFINKTSNGKEWFAMSFNNYPTLIKSAPISKYQLDLYRLKNNVPVDIGYLTNFNLLTTSSEIVEDIINGIHKIFHLTSRTMYQPVSRFDNSSESTIKEITDGRQNSISKIREDDYLPTIIDGIQFPNEVSLFDSEGSDLLLLNPSKELITKDTSRTSQKNEPLSLTKRIIEDIVVISGLFGLLAIFNKLNKYVKRLKKLNNDESINRHESGFGDEVIINEHSDDVRLEGSGTQKSKQSESKDIDDINTKNIDVSHSDSSNNEKIQTHLILNNEDTDKQNKTARKVTIVTPNETLEKDTEEVSSKQPIEQDEKSDSNDSYDELLDKTNDKEVPTKKKRKRGGRGGKRGGRKQNKNSTVSNTNENELIEIVEDEVITTKSLVKNNPPKIPIKKLQIENNLIISDKILGYGSHGTIVYQGTFENRPVAVKRMLLDFYEIASHEVRLLQESDDHPNVVRYFCSQSSETEKFLYIALELCLCSLEDIIEKPKSYPKKLRINEININDVLYQLASGLHYLHSLKIVHRDLKPQNILVADLKNKKVELNIRLLISDFGLCKKLDNDQSSFRATTQHAASGTSGWRAPELLLNHDLLEISPDTVSSIGSTSRHSINSSSTTNGKRLTKAIDIFSLGCVFYYILTGGQHPFGDRYLREGNIIKGEYDLSLLLTKCPSDKVEAIDLISSMINFNPSLRPNTNSILKHPFFWSTNKKLEFLLKVSDRFEIERRDPPSELLIKLEQHAMKVHQRNWHQKFSNEFMENLGKYRKYNSEKLMDLLRAIRNKYHHFNDMSLSLQQQMSPLPRGFYNYFNEKFPNLLMEIYFLVEENLKDEHAFKSFY